VCSQLDFVSRFFGITINKAMVEAGKEQIPQSAVVPNRHHILPDFRVLAGSEKDFDAEVYI
jgi:hypothetical protein